MVKRILCIIMLVAILGGCNNTTEIVDNKVTFEEAAPSETSDTDKSKDCSYSNDTVLSKDTASDTTVKTESVTEDTEPVTVGKLDGLKICIDPGHGNFETGYKEPIAPGASQTKAAFVSGTSGSYQTEAEFNLKMSYLLKEKLESEGAEVYMTRTDENATLSNVGRAEFANDLGCDMVVRIHADGSENTSVSGISVLVPGSNQYFYDQEIISASSEAGQSVLDKLIEKTGASNRGLVTRTDLTGFNWTKVPAILVECGFMSNPGDDALLADEDYRILLAEGITEGLIEYYMTVV